MSATHVVVVEGTLRPDGSLEVTQKLALPPGRVRITVELLAPSDSSPADLIEILDLIRRRQAERSYSGRTLEEMQADEAAKFMEDEEYEARWRAIHAQTSHPLPPEAEG